MSRQLELCPAAEANRKGELKGRAFRGHGPRVRQGVDFLAMPKNSSSGNWKVTLETDRRIERIEQGLGHGVKTKKLQGLQNLYNDAQDFEQGNARATWSSQF